MILDPARPDETAGGRRHHGQVLAGGDYHDCVDYSQLLFPLPKMFLIPPIISDMEKNVLLHYREWEG